MTQAYLPIDAGLVNRKPMQRYTLLYIYIQTFASFFHLPVNISYVYLVYATCLSVLNYMLKHHVNLSIVLIRVNRKSFSVKQDERYDFF